MASPRARGGRRRPRAARGWLVAAEQALQGAAVDDGRMLVERCLVVPGLAGETRARALLVRGRVHEAGTRWQAAIEDIDAALAWARRSGERRLELAALRARGGDAAVGAQLVADDLLGPLEDGVRLAAELGDRRAEADFGTRLAVLEASRLRLTDARRRAEQVLARARAADSEDGVVLALDGAKTVAWYLGDADALADAVEELEPLVRARRDAWLLQWVVFESAFVPAARDRWDEARDRVTRRSTSTVAAASPPTPVTSGLTTAGSPGGRATSTRRPASVVERSRTRRPSTIPGGTPGPAGLLAATLVRAGETDRGGGGGQGRAGRAERHGAPGAFVVRRGARGRDR